MKKISAFKAKLVVILALILSSTSIFALETYDAAGYINKLGIGSVSVSDQKYWITPTTKISKQNITKARLSDLKPGDSVFIKGYLVGERHYADFILYVPTKNK